MSAPDAGSEAAVTKPGNCDRIVFIGKDKHAIKHSWRLHSVPGKVRLATKLIDNRHRNRPSSTVHGLVRIADYYLRGDENEATAAARNEGRTPRIHMFTSRMAAGSSTREGGIFASWRTVCGKSASSSTTTLRPRVISKVATMGSAASLKTP